jgi:hypothetical protein
LTWFLAYKQDLEESLKAKMPLAVEKMSKPLTKTGEVKKKFSTARLI